MRTRTLSIDHLKAVQQGRELPTRVIQRLQILIQNRGITRVLGRSGELQSPLPIRMLASLPMLRRLPARLIGIGVRPEHVATPAIPASIQTQESAGLGSTR
jgi:hypothetical protein